MAAVLLAITLLIGLYVWLNRSRLGLSQRPRSYSSGQSALKSTSVRRQTVQELIRLTGGKRSVALRLVANIRDRYPQQSEQWCWEKAIYDIQRDRRA